jgi:hypothetical protein
VIHEIPLLSQTFAVETLLRLVSSDGWLRLPAVIGAIRAIRLRLFGISPAARALIGHIESNPAFRSESRTKSQSQLGAQLNEVFACLEMSI